MSEQIITGGDHQYKILNRDVIKYIAMFTMLLNHIAQGFLTNGTLVYKLMLSTGYFTAPVMLYFLVEGYYCTHSRKKYFLRLFLFAVVSELPFCLLFGLENQGRLVFWGMNMLFTLCLCFLLMHASSKLVLAAAFAIPAVLFGVNYNIVPYILYVGFIPLIAVLYCILGMAGIALAGVCIMCLYNGERMIKSSSHLCVFTEILLTKSRCKRYDNHINPNLPSCVCEKCMR